MLPNHGTNTQCTLQYWSVWTEVTFALLGGPLVINHLMIWLWSILKLEGMAVWTPLLFMHSTKSAAPYFTMIAHMWCDIIVNLKPKVLPTHSQVLHHCMNITVQGSNHNSAVKNVVRPHSYFPVSGQVKFKMTKPQQGFFSEQSGKKMVQNGSLMIRSGQNADTSCLSKTEAREGEATECRLCKHSGCILNTDYTTQVNTYEAS